MLNEITDNFDKNLRRVENLMNLYKSITVGAGRKPTNSSDLLRATVVLLHSTLEDFLRNILAWKLPDQNSSKLENVPLKGTSASGRKTKFHLGELVEFRSKNVNELIQESVKEYLNKQSFNNTEDIASALIAIGIEVNEPIRNYFTHLEIMIKRRHNIVHQADRQDISGRGYHRIKSISLNQVNTWKNNVDGLTLKIVGAL